MNSQSTLGPAKSRRPDTPADKSADVLAHTPPPAASSTASHRAGENPLSEREMDVARLLVTGVNNSDIASELFISPHTVKVHLRNIYEKLAVNTRIEASMLLVGQGWVNVPGIEATGEIPVAAAEEEESLEPEPLTASSGIPFQWQPIYLLLALLISLGVLFTPFFTRPTQSIPNLLSDGDAMALGRPTIADLPRWESRTPLGTARSRLALVAFNSTELYAIGGESSQGQPTAGVDIYNLSVNEWRSGPSLPFVLANAATATDPTRIIVAGGTTSDGGSGLTVSDRLLVFTPGNTPGNRPGNTSGNRPDNSEWSEWGRLPAPLAGASLVRVGDDFYLLGGWDGQAMRDEVWRLGIDTEGVIQPGDWQLVTHLASGRAFAGAAVVVGDLYSVGGYDGRQELRSAQVYDTLSGEWRELPDLALPRGGITLLYDGLALFAVGGGWGQPVDTIERFDPATGLWSNFPAPISGEWRHLGGAASSLGELYLVGGWSGSYLDVHLRYQSSFRTFFPSTKKDDSTPVVPQK